MSRLQRYDPFREMTSLRDAFNSLLEGSFVRPGLIPETSGQEGMILPLDINETPEAFVVTASLPGYKPGDVDVTVDDDLLTIRAEMKVEEEKKEKNYILRERREGSCQRSVRLGCPVEADKAVAKFENGVLNLTLPKTEVAKPKKIRLEDGSKR